MRNGTTTNAAARRGFTLIEILVTIIVVTVLISLITVGIRGAMRSSRSASDQFMASGLKTAVTQFRDQFGFLPPLVIDGPPLALANEGPILDNVPTSGFRAIAIRDHAYMTARLPNGQVDTSIVGPVGTAFSDKRYSKYSLPYYLMGAVGIRHDRPPPEDREIDWVEGAGFRTPLRDGRFDPRGRTHEPFYLPRDGDRLVRGYADLIEFREHGLDPASVTAPGHSVALVDSNGRAFRYYRWENSQQRNPNDPLGRFLNIPKVLQNPATWMDPNASAGDGEAGAAYRSASYAIVSPGPSGVFGTEPVAVLEERLGRLSPDALNDPVAIADLRRRAAADNVVEVGR